MKRVSIFTIRSHNFGNRLQNYALQTTITNLGYDCRTLQDKSLEMKVNKEIHYHPRLAHHRFIAEFYVKHRFTLRKALNKANAFDYFDAKYIRESNACVSKDKISVNALKKEYAIVAGSDQIWNTTFDFVSINSFLPFIHPRKIAYSASFGVNSILPDKNIAESINAFKALSVREKAGAEIINELTGRKAEVLIDPTLLLSDEEWRKLAKRPVNVANDYILTYFLSPMDAKSSQVLQKVCGGKKVYNLRLDDNMVGPSEFLWLFDHASLILTDSFHACVFSFLFDKPFLVFDRNWNVESMNSRLETLLSTFSLERKYANSGLSNDVWEHNYAKGYQQLVLERRKAVDFLKKALGD